VEVCQLHRFFQLLLTEKADALREEAEDISTAPKLIEASTATAVT